MFVLWMHTLVIQYHDILHYTRCLRVWDYLLGPSLDRGTPSPPVPTGTPALCACGQPKAHCNICQKGWMQQWARQQNPHNAGIRLMGWLGHVEIWNFKFAWLSKLLFPRVHWSIFRHAPSVSMNNIPSIFPFNVPIDRHYAAIAIAKPCWWCRASFESCTHESASPSWG